MPKPTLVIGDVHGHFDRLEALLLQEGIIGRCPRCNGTGDIGGNSSEATFETPEEIGREPQTFSFEIDPFCDRCQGEGTARINRDVEVIQLGDLGHWGGSTGSPTGDKITWQHADRWLDLVLWGNHDRALVDFMHTFGGYQHPGEVKALVDRLYGLGKLRMAAEAHGYLIVHAGVARHWKFLADRFSSAWSFSNWLNGLDQMKLDFLRGHKPRFNNGNPRFLHGEYDFKRFGVLDAIGSARGGGADAGGVLWMDWEREKHLQGDPFKFICGHTASKEGLFRNDEYGNWCIDIGGKTEARLGGLWLETNKEPRMVRVDL